MWARRDWSPGCASGASGLLAPDREPIECGARSVSVEGEYPLWFRSDLNGFHAWGYGGADAPAHLTHVRHLADVWRALDAAGQL